VERAFPAEPTVLRANALEEDARDDESRDAHTGMDRDSG
jgi:hypothetical protein